MKLNKYQTKLDLTSTDLENGHIVLDFYDIMKMFGITNGAIVHAMKKLFRLGDGEKTFAQDCTESIWSINRAVEQDMRDSQLLNEDES